MKYLDNLIKRPFLVINLNLTILFLIKFYNLWFYAKFITMIYFLLLTWLYPMINWPYFTISLFYWCIDPMICLLVIKSMLSINLSNTSLAGSTIFKGKSPPVKFNTSLSVTYDFLLRIEIGFLVVLGTCGR